MRQASAQKSRSNTFIDRTEVRPRTIGDSPTAKPVRPTAKSPPPSLRASEPETTTVAAPASAASRRIARSESPQRAVHTAVIAAMSGG